MENKTGRVLIKISEQENSFYCIRVKGFRINEEGERKELEAEYIVEHKFLFQMMKKVCSIAENKYNSKYRIIVI